MKVKVVIVSSGQPSANPRALKEAILLAENNYEVTFIYCPISKWADSFDKFIFEKYKNIKWIKAGYHFSENPFLNKYARVRKKIWGFIFKLIGNKFDSAIKSSILFYQELLATTKSVNADLYIGHNLGALPVIINVAKKYNSKTIFDFEDFHRGEHIVNGFEWNKIKLIEDTFAPLLDAAIAASPLIAKEYTLLYNSLHINTTLNCFPLQFSNERIIELTTHPIKLFWFSQTIGKERGLENVIAALGKMKQNKFELTLLGNHNDDTKTYFNKVATDNNFNNKSIKYLQPVAEVEIVSIAAEHHIGISSEMPTTLNRDLCLTNKIFMYLLAGNAIIFSNTKAQALFLKENSNIGSLFELHSIKSLVNILENYLNDYSLLFSQQNKSFMLAKNIFNWDIEKTNHLKNINEVIKKNSKFY